MNGDLLQAHADALAHERTSEFSKADHYYRASNLWDTASKTAKNIGAKKQATTFAEKSKYLRDKGKALDERQEI